MSTRRTFARSGLAFLALSANPALLVNAEDPPLIEVFKLPDCSCCKNWIKYLEKHGLRTKVTDVPDVNARTRVQDQFGVPTHLRACHTAIVSDYVIEGHVSFEEIDWLLGTRPALKGLFVKGMPKGSPGMEGGEPERYDVVAIDTDGHETILATHGVS